MLRNVRNCNGDVHACEIDKVQHPEVEVGEDRSCYIYPFYALPVSPNTTALLAERHLSSYESSSLSMLPSRTHHFATTFQVVQLDTGHENGNRRRRPDLSERSALRFLNLPRICQGEQK